MIWGKYIWIYVKDTYLKKKQYHLKIDKIAWKENPVL